ncbi:MAG: PBECR2 nuclease fold domain-containing protein [Lachnospiraceae bacterium]|nr:PBECR2 nuclease fold domain-containing protein [Lachnospiraceae bacterium]
MLSEQQIEIIAEALIPLFNYLEQEVIMDIAERISGAMAYTRTAELKAISMRALGYSPARIRKECMKLLNADEKYRKAVAKNTLEHKKEVRRLLNEILREAEKQSGEILKDAADTSYLNDLSIWKAAGMDLTDDSYLPGLVKAIEKQTRNEFKNLSRTTAFKSVSGYVPIENAYKRELDKAMLKVCSGAFSKEEVIRDTIHNLAASGLRTVKFESGYSMNLDTAVRNAVRTGVHQMQAKMMDENIGQTGVEYVYVPKHWGARNKGTGHANHEAWQGKVYAVSAGDHTAEAKRIGYTAIEDLYEATGYSMDGSRENDPLGLHGYNCRHSRRPWFAGISDLSNFPEDPEPAPVTIGKKTYDYYAVTQKMRSMERGVRALKKEREALRAMDMDTKEINYKIRRRTEAYKDFCKVAKVKENTERLRYECSKENLRRSKAWQEIEKEQNGLAKAEENDTLNTAKEEKGIEVHTIGRIDKKIYKCVTEDIVTDEVIITDERIAHIQERHPNDYERFCSYIPEILENPDYIIETAKPYTAVILKEIENQGEKFKLVLRIKVKSDPAEYKNSIMTFWHIGETTWKKSLKNKKILYKRE